VVPSFQCPKVWVGFFSINNEYIIRVHQVHADGELPSLARREGEEAVEANGFTSALCMALRMHRYGCPSALLHVGVDV